MSTRPGSNPPPLDRALEEFLKAETAKGIGKCYPASRVAPWPAAGAVRPSAVTRETDELGAAYERVLEHEAAKARASEEVPPPLWRRLLMPALVVVLGSAAAYVWFGHPSWQAEAPHATLGRPTTPISGQRQLVAIALQIDDFRRSTGRLPARLEELGLNLPQFSYAPLPGARYELHLGNGPHSLSYLSTPDAEPEIRATSQP